MEELPMALGLAVLGVLLRSWRAATVGEVRWSGAGGVALWFPLWLGVSLALLGAIAADLFADGTSLARGVLLTQLLFLPSAVCAAFQDVGAKGFGIASAFARAGWAVGLWVRAFPLILALASLVALLLHAVGWDTTEGLARQLDGANANDQRAVLLLGLAVAPLFEEVFFRGRLLARAAVHLGPERANLVQAVLFGLVHGLPVALPVAYLGWLLGRARLHGAGMGSLVLVHTVHNGIAFWALSAT